MRPSSLKQRGIVLIVVVIGLTLLASIALMLTSSTGIENALVRNHAENATLDYVAESGMAHASWQLAKNSSCANYTALASTAFGDHGYSATLTPTAGSPVTIIATGTLNTGTTRALTRNNVQVYQVPTVDTLQPGPEGIDTYIWDGAHKDTNFGVTAYMELNNASAERVILMRFDLSGVPSGAVIVGATLELWLEGGSALSNGVIDAHRVTQSWFEGEEDDNPPSTPGATYLRYDGSVPAALWANSGGGGDYDPVPVGTTVIPNLNQAWHQWDITALAQNGSQSELANNGVLLRASGGNVDKIKFTSSDGNAAEAPKLTVTYACECGQTCTAGGSAGNKLLFVVGNVGGPGLTSEETAHQTLIESWGYTVEIIDEDDSQAEFDTAVANNDVVFMTNDINASDLGTKLVSAPIGVVTSEDNLSDEFGLSSSIDWDSGTDVNVIDNTHYITSPFSLGLLTILGSSESLAYVSGTLSPDLGQLASSKSGSGVVTLEKGAAMVVSGTAAGRRAQLPWGGTGFTPNNLNAFGLAILQRALEWGAGVGPAATFETRIVASNDDAEQRVGDGYTDNTSSDLELAYDVDGSQTDLVGMRFRGVTVPQGATITSAYVQFQVDELKSSATSHSIFGQNFDSPDPFTTTDFDISDRTPTTASVPWAIPLWDTVGEAGPDQRTPDIAAIVQEIVDRPGWTSGNALVLMLTGSGTRTAESYDGDPDGAPMLHIEYSGAGGGGSQVPLAHWKLDETSGTTAADSVGGHDGTLINGPTWDIGKIDGALDFDGNNDHVNVPHHDTLSLTEAMTFTAWVNASSYNTRYQTILVKDGGGSVSNFWFGTYEQDVVFGFYAGGFFREEFTPGQKLQPGTWHHLAASFDNATGDVRLYADGIEVHSGTFSFSASAVAADLGIGVTPDGEYWPGLLDDVRIYDEVLAASAIADLAAGGGGGGGGGGSCDGKFRDKFDTISFSGSDGDFPWAGPWLEIGESDGAASGDVQVMNDDNDYQLRIRDNNNGGEGVEREADLSGAASAELSYEYRRMNLDTDSDYVAVEISGNGAGGPWDELAKHRKDNDSDYESVEYDISDYISNNTRIRFVSSPTMGNTDTVWFDDVRIDCEP